MFLEPGPVTYIRAKVTSTSAVLVWRAPLNVPPSVKDRRYHIVDFEHDLVLTSRKERIELNRLANYHVYTVGISLSVLYENQEFHGVTRNFSFRTDVGIPGGVRHLRALAIGCQGAVHAFWSPPFAKKANGPIDYYVAQLVGEQDHRQKKKYVMSRRV